MTMLHVRLIYRRVVVRVFVSPNWPQYYIILYIHTVKYSCVCICDFVRQRWVRARVSVSPFVGVSVLRIVLVYHVHIVGGIRFVQIIRKSKNNNGYENPKPVLPDPRWKSWFQSILIKKLLLLLLLFTWLMTYYMLGAYMYIMPVKYYTHFLIGLPHY